jgi:transcriptional regulator with XRE-family HTH domain
MSDKANNWSDSPESIPVLHPRRKYTIKLAAALRAGRSILGLSQVTFAQDMGISKSKLARAETSAGSISSGDLEYALSVFRSAGVMIDLTIEGDLRLTVPDNKLHLIEAAMTAGMGADGSFDEGASNPKTSNPK